MAVRALVLVFAVAGSRSGGRSMVTLPSPAAQKALFHPAWIALPADASPVMWQPMLTPPLPDAWPKPGSLVVFAYGAGMDLNLRDGERITAPFAMARFDAGASPVVTALAHARETVGTQGVRPLNAHEMATLKDRALAEAELAHLPPKLSPRAQAYYCLWASTHGVVRGALPAAQRGFFDSLGCAK